MAVAWLPGADEAGPVFGPDTTRKLAALTARRIEDDIHAAGWPVDQLFGSEGDLIVRYAVSRAVLREAIRLVEHHGIARMRRGSSGGLIIQEPDPAAVISAVVLYLEHVEASTDDLISVRRILEPVAAATAAQRISEDGIRELSATVDATEASASHRTMSSDDRSLHFLIATLSGNEVLALFVRILMDLTALYATTRSRITREDACRAAEDMSQAHLAIASAIVSGNSASAKHFADVHLKAVQDFLRPRRRARVRLAPPTEAAANHPKDKLAEIVARSIRTDIAELDLPIGSVIGSEDELRERYGVSRAVLREAVRLLEHHSVAVMRRGPRGGLIVSTPDPSASIEAAALFLRHRKASAADLQPVREALELGVVDLLANEANTIEIKAGLARIGGRDPAHPGSVDGVQQFHGGLADVAGNPVLTLLIRITLSLWSRHVERAEHWDHNDTDLVCAAESAHVAIASAIRDSDLELARQRMGRHLAALCALASS